MNSGDYLELACFENLVPDDEQTGQDFGFNRLPSWPERSRLLGLYIGLIVYMNVPGQTVYRWQREGTLVENIIREFSKLPHDSRGGYFPWFMENRSILDRSKFSSVEASHQYAGEVARKRFEMRLDPRDLHTLSDENSPSFRSMQRCRTLYITVIQGWHPSPSQPEWIDFGFCLYKDDGAEGELGLLYRKLIGADECFKMTSLGLDANNRYGYCEPRCTFREFWTAYRSNTLIAFFDSKGLRAERLSLAPEHFEAFMSKGRTIRPSVWDLKACLALGDLEHWHGPDQLIRSVMVDYGFVNCEGFVERSALRKVYQDVLREADPIDLHHACIEGQLYEFCSQYAELDISFKPLMKNMYPLDCELYVIEPSHSDL